MGQRLNVANDEGSGSIVMVGIVAMVLGLVVVMGLLATVVVARHHAQAGADLAALAAARSAEECRVGLLCEGEPCAVAAGIATSNGATVSSCECGGGSCRVVVTSPVPPLGSVEAHARAGPVARTG